jgi:hypothetical protein
MIDATPLLFDRFIGVDWSGARGPRLPGLQVAELLAGGTKPDLIPCPDGSQWSRDAFVAWLIETSRTPQRILIGFDFAFSFPKKDRKQFFPGMPNGPSYAEDLWRCVELYCSNTESFYAVSFIKNTNYGRYFQGGDLFERRLRITDQRCHQSGLGCPESIFRLVGPTQVAKGSLAGMRVLNHLCQTMDNFSVWPFDSIPSSRPVVTAVEIYPSALVRLSGIANGKVRRIGILNRILERFASAPVYEGALEGGAVDDKADALIATAALRHLSSDGTFWAPEGLSEAQLWQEGWMFGVR